jgi:hypothetical protein
MGVTHDSAIERGRRLVSRVAIAIALVLLASGLALFYGGSAGLSMRFFSAAFVVLVAMPILAVVAVLIEEIRGRDWTFVGAAGFVLALIAFSILQTLQP